MTLKVVSLFSGVGGFDLGFERAGMEVVAQAENDPKACGVLERHWPDVKLYRDVHDVTGEEWAGVDVVCGGFPCQDISVAGKQKGIAHGDKSVLWWEFYRVIEELRPRWVVIENVANLLNINAGRDLGAIIGSLDDLGYMGEWRVLDSQFFGVPQRRRRVFIVGHLGTSGRPAVLLEPASSAGGVEAGRQTGKADAALTSSGVGTCGADDNQAQAGHLIPAIALHLTQTPISGAMAPTLGASARIGVHDHMGVRRLTPVECERLQGFPDNWTKFSPDGSEITEGHRYRFMGNAVTVNVAEWIGRRIVISDRADS